MRSLLDIHLKRDSAEAMRQAKFTLILQAIPATVPEPCDVNGDGKVDISDINAIFAARNAPASGPNDPRDPDRDGMITVNDARICVNRCTNAHCAP